MQIKKIYNEKLALRVVKLWNMDKDIQRRFADISDCYHHFAAQDIRQKAREKWAASVEIRTSYKTFSDYLTSQFAEIAY